MSTHYQDAVPASIDGLTFNIHHMTKAGIVSDIYPATDRLPIDGRACFAFFDDFAQRLAQQYGAFDGEPVTASNRAWSVRTVKSWPDRDLRLEEFHKAIDERNYRYISIAFRLRAPQLIAGI